MRETVPELASVYDSLPPAGTLIAPSCSAVVVGVAGPRHWWTANEVAKPTHCSV
ncbi:hypothetical protein OJ998_22625 [Solirubrobacter taibaiensis]|nr:hypothetical protein [Solirubrobacter taibaiensis]